MPIRTPIFPLLFLFVVALLAVALAPISTAEQLPIKTYTTADGLARDGINHLFQDSHGFLWISTPEGISRFDGYEFTNYGLDHGLPHRIVNALLETRNGVYWLATENGLARFNPNGKASRIRVSTGTNLQGGLDVTTADSMFAVYHFGANKDSEMVTVLFEERSGVVWCGTAGGLYRIDPLNNEWTISAIEMTSDAKGPAAYINSLAEDAKGNLWIATENGLYRRDSTGSTQRYTTSDGLPDNRIRNLLRDKSGRMWAGTSLGLLEISDSASLVQRHLTTKDGLPANFISALYQTSDETIWIGHPVGLAKFDPNAPVENRFVVYDKANGVPSSINSMLEDRAGNLWLGSESSGIMKLVHNGLTTYGEDDGLTPARIASVFEDQRGVIHIVNGDPKTQVHRFDGRSFSDVEFRLPEGVKHSWGWNQVAFQDHAGEWWVPTNRGLFRFDQNQRPLRLHDAPDEMSNREIFRLYEDRRRDVWISVLGNTHEALLRWDRSTDTFHHYPVSIGLPASAPTTFTEDTSGNLWIGFYGGGLVRYRDGKFEHFTTSHGLPSGQIRGLYADRRGRLWIGANGGGLGRIDDTNASQPNIAILTTAQGLASDYITCLTEDHTGQIFVGTARGLDQLDPDTGRIKHFNQNDGLANNYVNVAFRDRTGALWFGTLDGLSRLVPTANQTSSPPNIKLSRLNIAGEPQQISALGAEEIKNLELSASQNQLQIDFVSLSFQPGSTLRYQYKLEGADDDWSVPSEQRSITYANLSPGTYRFLVRAIGADGVVSERPATISFRIIPQFWRRWWFLTLVALAFVAGVYVLSRRRLMRLKVLRESENRFRTLAETASDAIITINANSKIVYVNAAAENVFGYTISEMMGSSLTMLMPEYLRHLHEAGLTRYVETGNKHIGWEAVELPGLHKSGREIPLELSFGEFTRDDKRFFTGIARDITERRRSEEALRRTREERLIELERVRKRIARDLHDDIGSSLTQISLLSEVVRQRVDNNSQITEPLATIATSSRELVDSMSDIVWAINPQKDHMRDLLQRMRGLASDVFTNCDIKLRFSGPDAETDVRLGANLRREIFLVFKESLNNIVKHAGATEVGVEFRVGPNSLFLSVEDNGRGFDPSRESDGHGLLSMSERIREMGGTFEMNSQAGVGTTITVHVPMNDPL